MKIGDEQFEKLEERQVQVHPLDMLFVVVVVIVLVNGAEGRRGR